LDFINHRIKIKTYPIISFHVSTTI